MKIQKLIFSLGLVFLSTSAFAADHQSEKVNGESLKPAATEEIAEAAIDQFDETVEFWVVPVPTAAEMKEKAGIEA